MAEEKKGFFKRLVSGLTKTRDNIVAGVDSIFKGYRDQRHNIYPGKFKGTGCRAAYQRANGM